MTPPSVRLGTWLVLGAAALWGTTGTAKTLAPGGAEPFAVGIIRLVIGAVGLLAVAAVSGNLVDPRRLPRVQLIIAGGAMAASQPLFFAAVGRTGVAVGTIVTIGSAPILIGLLAMTIRHERLDRRWVVATALAIGGTIVLLGGGEDIGVDAGGVALALGAGAAYAIYAVAAKDLVDEAPPIGVMAAVFGVAALALAPFFPLADFDWLAEPGGLAAALWLGVIATVAAYTLFGMGLRMIPVSSAATLSLAEPVTAAILGIVVLGEDLTPVAAAGGLAVLLGLVVLTTSSPERATRAIRRSR